MKEVVSWLARSIVLPLLPALIGAVLRAINSGELNANTFDTGELAFSMAMLSIIVMTGASRLNDKPLRDSLVAVFTVETALFLALFACATLVKVQIESAMMDTASQIRNIIKVEPISSLSISSLINDKHYSNNILLLSRIRTFVVGVAIVIVPLTILFKFRYKLED